MGTRTTGSVLAMLLLIGSASAQMGEVPQVGKLACLQEGQAPTIGKGAGRAPQVDGSESCPKTAGGNLSGGGQLPAGGGHDPAPAIDNDQDGVLPHHSSTELDFTTVEAGGALGFHAVMQVGLLPLDIVVLDGAAFASLYGQVIVAGDFGVLNMLPGGTSAATAGIHGCFVKEGELQSTIHQIDVTGEGDTIGQAVEDFHKELKKLEDQGYEPMPSSVCD